VKSIIVAKSKEVKTRYTLAESSRKGYGSKGAVLLVVMMMRQELQTLLGPPNVVDTVDAWWRS
jgi:hypothetical protein